MTVRTTRWTALAATLLVLGFGSAASAQWDPEGGDNWQAPPDQQQQQQQTPQETTQQTTPQQGWGQGQQQQQQGWGQGQQQGWSGQDAEQPPAGGGAAAPAGASDHSGVVGHMGIGWFGISSVDLAPGTGADLSVAMPNVGLRYWLSEGMGLDLGLGFGFSNLGGEVDAPGGVASADISEALGLQVHVGVPISLYHSQHYNFVIIPELDAGFGSGTIFGATPNDDQEVSAVFVGLGGRIGAEIHFGFIDIPELTLEGSVGLALSFVSRSLENDFGNPAGSTITTIDEFVLSTTVQEDPWDILVGGLRAIYYFK